MFAVDLAAEELRLDRDREILVARHRARIRRMQHRARIAERPRARVVRRLFADEAVFDDEAVKGERFLVEDVSELPVEAVLAVLVVAHLQEAVLDAPGVREVLAELVLRDLRRPAREVAAVEHHDPVFFRVVRIRRRRLLRERGRGGEGEEGQ
jgi:hypothetical protein